MPGKSLVSYGNLIIDTMVYLATFPYPIVGANASVVNTQSLPGCLPGDLISWNIQAGPAHLQIDNVYVSAPGVITVTWGTDATGITPGGNIAVLFGISRADGANLGITAIPAALV